MPDDEQTRPDLGDLRERIDAIDAEIVRLISERGVVARQIGEIKAQQGTAVYAADREKGVYERLREINPGPFPDQVLQAIYRELMSGSIALERPQRIGFLGPRGSFSHLAATAKFGSAVEYEPVTDIQGVFAEVERRHVDFAVVPVENTSGGSVLETLDAFIDSPVKVCAEVNLHIHHNVLSRIPLDAVERLYSKPEVFDQCKAWLLETGMLPKAIPVASSNRAAEMAATEERAAAVGSTLAAELFNLPVLISNIEDNPQNMTRFLVLGQRASRPTGDDKTVLMFRTAHRAGALVDVLDAFRANQINMSMITSRPNRQRNWEYCFFVDIEGHADDANVAAGLRAAGEHCLELAVLGSYPKAAELA